MIVLKTILKFTLKFTLKLTLKFALNFTLKFTLKHLRPISVQSHYLQRSLYQCLLQLKFVLIINDCSTVYDVTGGDGSILVVSLLVFFSCAGRKSSGATALQGLDRQSQGPVGL